MAETAALLVDEVLPARPLRQWVLSLPYVLRFLLATNPAALTQVLGVVYRTISGFVLQRSGLTRATGATGAQLQVVVQQIAERVGRLLERRGLVERDMEYAWLAGDGEAGSLDDLIGPSITYRIAVGPRAGQKLFTLQTVPARDEAGDQQGEHRGVASAGGFSLHAGIGIAPGQRQKLERLCRYVSRPPVATERLGLISSGCLRYALKTPYRDGTTHIVLEPLDLMARLAALVPPPRMHLTRFHGVFAPHSKLRAAQDSSPASKSPRSLRRSSRTSSAWRRSSTRPSGRLARGHRRRRPACCESDGEGRLGGPVTRPGRGGACGHSRRRQPRPAHQTHYANRIGQARRFESTIRPRITVGKERDLQGPGRRALCAATEPKARRGTT